MTKRQIVYFVCSFAIVLIGRLSVAGTGYLEDQDEFLYIWIHLNAASFAHLSAWTDCLFRIQGQPPEVAIRLLEYISLIPVANSMHQQMLHPDILYFVGLYNILASLLILYVFYRILLKLNLSIELALTGVMLMGTLFHFNMYTRHILPYDHALLFQLLSLNLLLRDNLRPRIILLAGLLSAIGLTNYFGGFMFVFINGGLLLLTHRDNPKLAIRNCLLFISSFAALLLFYEVLTHVDGRSYLAFFRQYSQTVGTEGSPDESLIFVFLYFYFVEKWWGLLLLFAFFIGSHFILKRGDSFKAKHLILLAVVAYLSFGMFSFISHKLVFDGRVLHIYFPFIILGALGWLQQQKLTPPHNIAAAFILFACVNYFFVIRDLNSIGYPRNAIYKYHLFEDKTKTCFTYYEDIPGSIKYSAREGFCIDSIGQARLPSGDYVLQNICFLPTYSDSIFQYYKPLNINKTDSVIIEEPHFESHPAYAMEYCTHTGREFFISRQFKIRVVKTKRP